MRQRCPIDSEDFRTARLVAGLTVDQVAELLFVTARTVRYWKAGRSRIPSAAYKRAMISEVYDALKEAGASENKAKAAAEAIAAYPQPKT